jgi:hypothetical protein
MPHNQYEEPRMSRHASPRLKPFLRRPSARWGGLILSLTASLAVTGMSDLPAQVLTASSSTSCPDGSGLRPVALVNVGGPAVTADGQAWSADPSGPGTAATSVRDVAGTTADVLFQTARTGAFSYEIPVPTSGRYETRLFFAETWFGVAGHGGGRGSRVFSVNLEGGRTELRNFDIFAGSGSMRAVVKSYTTTVADGRLTITGTKTVGDPLLNAVAVFQKGSSGTCTDATTPPSASLPTTPPATGTPTPATASPLASSGPGTPSSSSSSTTPSQQATPSQQTTPSQQATPTQQTASQQATQSQRVTPSSAPAPSAAVVPSSTAGSLAIDSGRPFTSSSAWNTPIAARPVVDPRSSAMVSSVASSNRATANLYAYGDPVFSAVAGSPTATVDCTQNWGTCDVEGRQVRIPADAQPTTGSDGRMIIVDLVDRTSCDYWQARKVSTGRWTTGWATCAPLDGDGRGPSGGATGAGVNALTGVIRTFEMRSLQIPHALSVATNNSCANGFRYPATKTDGKSTRADCIPEGARLQLDPSINVDALPGITPGERAVAHALQTYGAINRDNCGSNICVSFEAPIGESDPYPAAGFTGDYYTMPHIPWTQLRVVQG